MTTRTTTYLICTCGHRGVLRTAENDQPYSKEWFNRTVEGFIDNDDGFGFKELTCRACGKHGEVSATEKPPTSS